MQLMNGIRGRRILGCVGTQVNDAKASAKPVEILALGPPTDRSPFSPTFCLHPIRLLHPDDSQRL